MVGVAGKSKGCNTCRSRKVKCDAQRPSCGVCLRTGRTCGGYDRWPVFINRTAKGVEKRSYLAEVKETSNSTNSESHLPTYTYTVDEQTAQSCVSRPIRNPDEVIQWFAVSSIFSNEGTRTASFMIPIMSIRTPNEVLHASLMAVSMMKLGRTVGDGNVVLQAHNLYSKGLRQLQKALNDTTKSREDDTLASAVVLCTFEVLQGAPGYAIPGWQKHIDGIATILKHRGPAVCRSPISLAIFEHCRDLFMFQSMLDRKASAFAAPAWLTEPWLNVRKTAHQQLRDSGLILTGLIQQADHLTSRTRCDLSAVKELVINCEHLYQSICLQQHACKFCDEDAHFLTESQSAELRAISQATSAKEKPQCKNVYMDCILSRVFRLICCTVANDMLHKLQADAVCPSWDEPQFPVTIKDSSIRASLGRAIVDIASQFWESIDGLENRARVRWALTLALEQLDPSDQASIQCEMLIHVLQDDVSSMPVGWPAAQHVDQDIRCIYFPRKQSQ